MTVATAGAPRVATLAAIKAPFAAPLEVPPVTALTPPPTRVPKFVPGVKLSFGVGLTFMKFECRIKWNYFSSRRIDLLQLEPNLCGSAYPLRFGDFVDTTSYLAALGQQKAATEEQIISYVCFE